MNAAEIISTALTSRVSYRDGQYCAVPADLTQLMNETGYAEPTVRRALYNLVREGRAERVPDGYVTRVMPLAMVPENEKADAIVTSAFHPRLAIFIS